MIHCTKISVPKVNRPVSNSDLITNKRLVKTVIGWHGTQNESFKLWAQNHDIAVETYNNFMAFNLSWFHSQIESFSFLKNHGVWFIAKYYDRLNFWILNFLRIISEVNKAFFAGHNNAWHFSWSKLGHAPTMSSIHLLRIGRVGLYRGPNSPIRDQHKWGWKCAFS